MPLTVVPVEEQAHGQFNDGAILENKPIGFPQDGGRLRPYSSLFYWAHAWTPGEKSLIGEHPHRGFEIMTFVLEGSVEHYDSKNRDWRKLSKGDVQIIRAGRGISHAELLHAATEMFQIWLDPGLERTMTEPASYDDYRASSFPELEEAGRTIKTYHGKDAPLTMTTPGVVITEIRFAPGRQTWNLDPRGITSAYLLDGRGTIGGKEVERKGFVIIEGETAVTLSSGNGVRLFVIESPQSVGYETYADRFR